MVFKSSPRRRLVVQAGKKLWRPGRHESSAYGVGSRHLGGHGVDFQQGGRRAVICARARGGKRAGIRAPTLPAATYLVDGVDSEGEREREGAGR